jgi:hypothetical protein
MPKARNDGAGDWLEDRVFLRVPEIEGCSPGPPGSSGWVARCLKIDFSLTVARMLHASVMLRQNCSRAASCDAQSYPLQQIRG